MTPWSVVWGLVMAVLFSAAAAYSGLKIGQVFEAAIPIAILAVGLSAAFGRQNALGQNVIIQSIGASSGVIVAGAIFTHPGPVHPQAAGEFLPGFRRLRRWEGFSASCSSSRSGSTSSRTCTASSPFPKRRRRPRSSWPGEKGGRQAAVLVVSGLIGGLFDFAFSAFGSWSEVITSRMFDAGAALADR